MPARITVNLNANGELEMWLNPEGRDILFKELQGLSENLATSVAAWITSSWSCWRYIVSRKPTFADAAICRVRALKSRS
jgi:hypothetical protein